MIDLIGVSKSYGGTVNAVDQMNLTVPSGKIFGFLGPNGAGKTTTLKMVTGILSPDAGEIRINHVDIKKEPLKAKMQFGFVPDSPDIFLRLKGLEYLNFMADIYLVPREERQVRIKDLTARFGLDEVLGDQLQSYSHGMRQKIVIIGALLHNPAVWVLDEPLTGLDPKSSFILKEMMKEHVQKGNTVFFSTHVLEVAEKLCDQVAVINKGKIVFKGTLDEMRQHFREQESLEEMFLEMTENE